MFLGGGKTEGFKSMDGTCAGRDVDDTDGFHGRASARLKTEGSGGEAGSMEARDSTLMRFPPRENHDN